MAMRTDAMKAGDVLTLGVLGALWGGSYLFLRTSAAEFGPLVLAALRAGGAAALLLPLSVGCDGLRPLRAHAVPIAILGVTNCALPYLLFSYAALTVDAGVSAMFSASVPMFTALIGWLWLRHRLDPHARVGLVVGFVGVWWMVSGRLGVPASGAAAMGACLAASLCYGASANLAKRHLHGVSPLAIAGGGQMTAALLLVVPAATHWPATVPGLRAWAALGALTVASTAVAYVLYYRLISRIGPARTTTVTYLIPLFGALWGGLFLHERLPLDTIIGGLISLAGVAWMTGATVRRATALASKPVTAPAS